MKKGQTKLSLFSIIVLGLMFVGMLTFVPVDGLAQDGIKDPSFEGTTESAGPHWFYPVTPCRISDSRTYYAPWSQGSYRGPFNAGQTHCFDVYGGPAWMTPQGGNQNGCYSPTGEPGAFHLVVSAVPVSGAGHVRLWPANVQMPMAAVLSWSASAGNIMNAVSSDSYEADPGQEFCIYIGGYGSTHIIMDVMGYFD